MRTYNHKGGRGVCVGGGGGGNKVNCKSRRLGRPPSKTFMSFLSLHFLKA